MIEPEKNSKEHEAEQLDLYLKKLEVQEKEISIRKMLRSPWRMSPQNFISTISLILGIVGSMAGIYSEYFEKEKLSYEVKMIKIEKQQTEETLEFTKSQTITEIEKAKKIQDSTEILKKQEESLALEVTSLQSEKQTLAPAVENLEAEKERLSPLVNELIAEKNQLEPIVVSLKAEEKRLSPRVAYLASEEKKLSPKVTRLLNEEKRLDSVIMQLNKEKIRNTKSNRTIQ